MEITASRELLETYFVGFGIPLILFLVFSLKAILFLLTNPRELLTTIIFLAVFPLVISIAVYFGIFAYEWDDLRYFGVVYFIFLSCFIIGVDWYYTVTIPKHLRKKQ